MEEVCIKNIYMMNVCKCVCIKRVEGGLRVKREKREKKSGREVKNRRLEEKPKIKVQLQSGVNVTRIIYFALQTERQSRINQGQPDYHNGWH
jgi:hypothetical protein